MVKRILTSLLAVSLLPVFWPFTGQKPKKPPSHRQRQHKQPFLPRPLPQLPQPFQAPCF